MQVSQRAELLIELSSFFLLFSKSSLISIHAETATEDATVQ